MHIQKLILALLLLPLGLNSQIRDDILSKFRPLDFKAFHVHDPDAELLTETNSDPLFGNLLNMEDLLQMGYATDEDSTEVNFHAIGRYWLNGQYEAFIVREKSIGIRVRRFFLMVFEQNKDKLIGTFEIAELHGSEGAWGKTEAWLMDLNNDGIPDILMRSEHTGYIQHDDSVSFYTEDKFSSLIWEGSQFIKVKLEDSNTLKSEFKFYNRPTLSMQAAEVLARQFARKGIRYEHPTETKNWLILVSQHDELMLARSAQQATIQHLKDSPYLSDQKDTSVRIFKKGGQFVIGIGGFIWKAKAEATLSRRVRGLNKNAYIVEQETYCPKGEIGAEGYFNCE